MLQEGLIHRDPRTHRLVRVISQDQLDMFQREYVTLSQIAREMSTLPKHAARRLHRAGIQPLALPDRCSKIYRRAEIDAL